MTTNLRSDFVIGFLGAGQLARMSAMEAFHYGIQVASFSDRKEMEPLEFTTPYSFKGSFSDPESMLEFARFCDVITLENEFIPSEVLRTLQEVSGTPIFPSPDTFALIENKLIEKQTFEMAGISVTPYRLLLDGDDAEEFGNQHGWPFILKSSKGGYDGYGNRTVKNINEARKAFDELGGNDGHDILAEAFVDFTHELAVQAVRNESGTAVYPCVETVQKNHICVAVKAPASVDPDIQKDAQILAKKAIEAIDGKGIFAFEFFLTNDRQLLLNESAPRPHNSGHYTIEGCVSSQFENHVRAVTGLPLGSTKMRSKAAVMINLLGTHNRKAEVEYAEGAITLPDGHLHNYGKLMSKPGRKMGHYTLLGDDLESVYKKAVQQTINIQI